MSCSSPVDIRVNCTSYSVPCRRCISCRMAYQSSVTMLAERELASMYDKKLSGSFLTLTYHDDYIPFNKYGTMTLVKSDAQKFLKRLRITLERNGFLSKIKYIHCGEYGEVGGRPHYHFALFGVPAPILRKYIHKLWPYGFNTVKPLCVSHIRYVCKYIMKSHPTSDVSAVYDGLVVQRPYISRSFGLGSDWIRSHAEEIAENGYKFVNRGSWSLYPVYIMKYVNSITGVDYKPFVIAFLRNNAPKEFKHSLGSIEYKDYALEKARMRERAYYRRMISSGHASNKPDWSQYWHKRDSDFLQNYIKQIT